MFETEAINTLKALNMTPSIRLLGFAARSRAPEIGDQTKHAYFLYPCEKLYEGSTRTFAAMLQSMLDHNLCAFAVMLTRKRATPRHVYILPQAESIDEQTGEQLDPPGFHVYTTVYNDDRRRPPPITNQQQWFTEECACAR